MSSSETTLLVIVGAIALYMFVLKPMRSIEKYSNTGDVSASLLSANISNNEKDKPTGHKELTAIGLGAINGVQWPAFQVNLPRLDDRAF